MSVANKDGPTTGASGFRSGNGPVDNAQDFETADADVETEGVAAELLPNEVVAEIRETVEVYEAWGEAKTEAVVADNEWIYGRNSPLSLNQAQGVIGKAIGIMATLMIGVVVLGKIDAFTLDLTGGWSETANDVSNQSQQTFGFLNLVPFLLVALFILGIMASRM